MENHIIAIDVNGIAGTLTAKRLTDLDVQQVYEGSKIAVTDHPAGSLSLLDPSQTGVSEVLGYRDVTQMMDQQGNFGLFHVGLEGAGVDWSLMNPPYSRPRRGRVQPTKGLSPLRNKARQQGYGMSHGQAGLGSDFGNLSAMRLKGDGVLSHVLPFTAAYSGSWQKWREGIETHFEDITVVTNTGDHRLTSMSADTGMSEMLVVATKRREAKQHREWRRPRILCVNLFTAPLSLSEGYALANEIQSIDPNRPSGRSDNFSYAYVDTPSRGFPWYGVGNLNIEVSAIVSALLNGQCYDPRTLRNWTLGLNMATLQVMSGAGPTHDLLGHPAGHEDTRGAFEWTPIEASDLTVHTHTSMWAANARTQKSMNVSPTHTGQVVNHELAQRMVESKSKWFLNRGVSWTSQAILVAHTVEETYGGRAWNALQNLSDTDGAAIALFYNSIFGALLMRAYGQSPQQGPRAQVQVGAIPGLPCPDFKADTPQAERARRIADMWFDSFAGLELRPFPYCHADENRHQIDSTVAEMLGLDPNDSDVKAMLAHYRLLFASEPNVNGRNKNILAALEQFGG